METQMLRSLLVGLKSVDAAAYGGWNGQNGCWGCELDIDNIEHILKPLGYHNAILKTQAASATAVLAGLEDASKKCQAGDMFVFYFSGHGGQQPDSSGDEQDGKDETLVAYDREITDDELNAIWPKFKTGVRIFMLSDSCNSGTNYKMSTLNVAHSSPMRMFSRAADSTDGRRTARSTMKAQMIHYGGCKDGFTSSGYMSGGAFTQALCQTWNEGQFGGDYTAFYQAIKSKVTSGQVVQFSKYGPVEDAFLTSRPFGATKDGAAVGGLSAGTIKSVRCVLDISESHISGIRAAINNEAAKVLLEALDDAMSQRPGSASVSCTGSSGGGVSCTGSVSVSW